MNCEYDIDGLLKRFWGYESFRPMQREIITSALDGRDTLAILPTGGGKSVCFQVPALCKDGICIVVSPLIALMKDQVANLRKRGVKALAVYSGMSYREIDTALDNAVYGEYKFLYVSPERLRTPIFQARAARMNVSFLVVDEAHCISQWGYDFRPDYLEIASVRELLCRDRISVDSSFIPHPVPIIALTATATPKVADDIMEKLRFTGPNLLKSGFERPNLSYVVRETEDKLGQMMRICNGIKGSGIVYARQRKKAEELASFLLQQGFSAEAYHAGMSKEMRSERQDRWMNGHTRIIVATNAFGMGIDKPDVRFVIHESLPDSIESYFQEAGRAGRDGRRSYAVMLYCRSDISRLRQILNTSFPPADYIRDIYQKVYRHLGFAYETGAGQSVKFDLSKCAREIRTMPAPLFHAIKYLETLGLWNLSDEVTIPSRVQFAVSRDSLYGCRTDASTDEFLSLLMRMYPGIFSEFVTIDEEFIARSGRYTTDMVKRFLISLSKDRIIKYIPTVCSPLLSLNTERLTPDNLPLAEEEYAFRKGRFQSRMDAMVEYATQKDICRSRYLLNYFGQEKSCDCGACDICLGKKR